MKKFYSIGIIILAATVASILPGCITTAKADCCTITDDGVNHQMSALEMSTNEVITLLPGPNMAPGGEWFAQLGTFDPHEPNKYFAPDWASYAPELITYVEPDGTIWNLLVSLEGSRSIISLPPDEKGEADLESQAYKLWFYSNNDGGDIHISGTPLPEPISWTDKYSISPINDSYLVPVMSDGTESDFFLISYVTDIPAEQGKGKIVTKRGPLNDYRMPPDCNRIGAQHYVKGYTNKSVTRGAWRDQPAGMQTITIDATFSGQIKAIYNISIGANTTLTINATSRDVNWREAQIRDLYECRKGKWVYVGSQKCTRTGSGQEFNPTWWSIIAGWPPYGRSQPMTPWQCVKTTKGL